MDTNNKTLSTTTTNNTTVANINVLEPPSTINNSHNGSKVSLAKSTYIDSINSTNTNTINTTTAKLTEKDNNTTINITATNPNLSPNGNKTITENGDKSEYIDDRYKPDGKYAFLILFSSFLLQSCCYGLPLSFGIFQDYYINNTYANESKYKISLIGTVCLSVMGLGSALSGRLLDYTGIKTVIVLSMFFIVTSQLLASFSTKIWELILTQGLLFGIGNGILYIPSNAVVSFWFIKRRGLAYGICSAGAGLGTLFYSMINAKLLFLVGPSWTLRIDGFIMLIQLLLCLIVMKTKPPMKPSLSLSNNNEKIVEDINKPKFDKSQILNVKFMLVCIAMLFFACSYPTTLFNLPNQISSRGYSLQDASTVLSILSGLSAIGRIGVGYIADYLGHVNVYLGTNLIAVLCYILLFISSKYAMFVAFGVVFGLFSGGIVGMFGAVITALFGTKNIGLIMGLTYAPTGLGELIGPPLAGVIMDYYKKNLDLGFAYINLFTCVLLGLSCLMIASIKLYNYLYYSKKSNTNTVSSQKN